MTGGWVQNGLVINVFDKRYNPIIEDAKDERFPIRIRINGAKKDDKNHEVVNGFYRLDENALDETKGVRLRGPELQLHG